MEATVLLEHDALEPTERSDERRLVRVLLRVERVESRRHPAEDVALEVRPVAADLSIIHHPLPRAPTSRGLRLALGSLPRDEPRHVLLEFAVPVPRPDRAPDPVPVADLFVTASVRDADGTAVRREIHLPVAVTPGDGPRREPEVRRQLALIAGARARHEAKEARRAGQIHRALYILRQAGARARATAERHPEPVAAAGELRREARRLEEMADRLEELT